MLILLPPSEGKAEGGRPGTSWSPSTGSCGRLLGRMRSEVAAALASLEGGDERLLGVKGKALERARGANMVVSRSPVLPAWQRYTGVVWDHLDLASMSGPVRTAASKRVLVPSGLLGLVRADDPVPDYKLKMGATLPRIGRLARWWRAAVTAEISRLAAGHTVVNLLPKEHADAVDWDQLHDVIHVDLVARRGGAHGGHFAKAAKGTFARHLLDNHAQPVTRAVSSFRHPTHSARIR